jgi:ferredoxin
MWIVNIIKAFFPGRFLAARVTRIPVIGQMVERTFFKGDGLFYLPKDNTIAIDVPIENPSGIVLPSKVVEYFIEISEYRWIMHTCLCRESNGCKDYPINYGCLFLGEAVLGINPALGRMVNKEEALAHVRRCREAGLVHLIGRNKLDSIWLGVGPGTKLLTICNCCSCCCLWKMLPYLKPVISEKVSKMPGVKVTITERCKGCGTCQENVCFVDAIRLIDHHAEIGEDCRGCGRCMDACPNDAIELIIDDLGFVQEAIDRISMLVDVSK